MKIGGDHYGAGVPGPYWNGQPYAVVDTGAAAYTAWSYAFSHEILEMLVDPNDNRYFAWPNGVRQLLEVCDPVESITYPIGVVSVEDFTLPAAWSGGSGPYDGAGELTAPLTHRLHSRALARDIAEPLLHEHLRHRAQILRVRL